MAESAAENDRMFASFKALRRATVIANKIAKGEDKFLLQEN